jgi:hypothetical protein
MAQFRKSAYKSIGWKIEGFTQLFLFHTEFIEYTEVKFIKNLRVLCELCVKQKKAHSCLANGRNQCVGL